MPNTFHQELLTNVKEVSNGYHPEGFAYVGTTRPYYDVNVPTLRKIARNFLKVHADLTQHQYETLLTSLYQGKSFTERIMPGFFLQYDSVHRAALNPK